ncbi:zf-HC2 domain-containing protein [Streptomonospora halophila]|uniref:Zf-HC2 domain-containing protein n=1 Tax=Streptomonospora halophila TaxID=427369 RepID=A0ABP9GLL7_9ACTN
MNDQHKAHASIELIRRYARADAIAGEVLWSLESHLESCPSCRARLAKEVPGQAPPTAALVDRTWEALAPSLTTGPPVPRRGRLARLAGWTSPVMLPWVVGAALVAVLAVAVDSFFAVPGGRPLVLLLAPVVPVLGIAAVWTKSLDPAYELVAATPRAGLYLLLRRTVAVLAVVMPVLVVAGLTIGTSSVVWLLPCLACTAVTLALGSVIRLERAAVVVVTLWSLGVLAPGLLTSQLPVAVAPVAVPVWGAVFAVAAAVLILRARSFARV